MTRKTENLASNYYVSDVRQVYRPGRRISSPEEAAALFREELGELDRERFYVALLSTKNDVLGVELVSIGTLSASLVHPREVFKPAIAASAASIVVAHNHPSGDPSPSSEDFVFTKRIVEAGELLGIHVLDHIVIGADVFHSLKEEGQM